MSKLRTEFRTEHEVALYFEGVRDGYKVLSGKEPTEKDKKKLNELSRLAVSNLPLGISAMIEFIQECPDKLTAWKCEFISSINEQFSGTGSLSKRQTEILEKIYVKALEQ